MEEEKVENEWDWRINVTERFDDVGWRQEEVEIMIECFGRIWLINLKFEFWSESIKEMGEKSERNDGKSDEKWFGRKKEHISKNRMFFIFKCGVGV